MSNQQQQQKQKFKINISDDRIPESEYTDLLSLNRDKDEDSKKIDDKIWKKSGDTEFWNSRFEDAPTLFPTMYSIIMEESNKKENADKSLQFVFKGHMFGVREGGGFQFLWRVKLKESSGGGSGGGNNQQKQSFPLEELWFGSIVEANLKLSDDKNKRWYLVKEIVTPDGKECRVLLKRNRKPDYQQTDSLSSGGSGGNSTGGHS